MVKKKLKLTDLVDGLVMYNGAACEEKTATSLESLYSYWKETLLNRVIRLFEWNGLPFEQHELEINTILLGNGFVAYDKEAGLVTRNGNVYGVTRYSDVYTNALYSMPSEKGKGTISGDVKLGVDAVMLKNTSLQMGMMKFLMRYASLLAHGDLTYKSLLINRRTQETLASADSSTTAAINDYYNARYKGQPQAILDKSLVEIQNGTTNLAGTIGNPDFMNILDAQNEIMRAFYRDIGIRWTKQKRGNMIEEEVDSDGQMLLFNISDMLHCREQFCKEYNKVFNGRANPISVKIASELQTLVNSEEVKEDEKNEDSEDK